MKKQKSRKLKICGQFRDNGHVPQLRLSGKWMERLGFNVGDQVNITMRNQLLIIEPIQEMATTESKPKPKNDYEPLLRKIDEAMKRLAR